MTEKEKKAFISSVAKYVEKHRREYDIQVCSPIIAQAILESGFGRSELAVYANNYFGLKYKPNRCPKNDGYYVKLGSEQLPDGSYVSSVMKWYKFSNMEDSVIGYLSFTSKYKGLKDVVDPRMYIENIKSSGYATSIKYVDNLMRVIEENNLTEYDKIAQEERKMGNSPLVTYTKLSPNCTKPRTHAIDMIIIHCVVGQVTIKRLGDIFANPRKRASSNYGVDKDGKIGMFVEEKNRAWCSGGKDKKGNPIRVNGISGADIDHRAISIEVASDTTTPYAVTSKAFESLIQLVADIAERNNIKVLKWEGDKKLVGKVEKQNMAVHRWFANKSCPGDYLYNKMGEIASRANLLINGSIVPDVVEPGTKDISVTYESIKVGDILNFVGSYNYASAGRTAKATKTTKSLCKVTKKYLKRSAHPIHVRAVNKSYISGVYGWVNIADLTKTVDASSSGRALPYVVKITPANLFVYAGPGLTNKITYTVHHNECYTIVEESIGGWGKLKSGRGWIQLSRTTPK